jgi:hypothetical protein
MRPVSMFILYYLNKIVSIGPVPSSILYFYGKGGDGRKTVVLGLPQRLSKIFSETNGPKNFNSTATR